MKRSSSIASAKSLAAAPGDLTTGRAFDSGCECFADVDGSFNGQWRDCHCGVSESDVAITEGHSRTNQS